MLPVVTLGGLAYANLLAGAVMTETVFSWPGLGRYTFRSAVAVDFPAIMAITAIVAAIFVLVNFLVDMSYALLDPRVVKTMSGIASRPAVASPAHPAWLRRYGLAAFGAAIILAWVLAAIFGALVTPL